MNKFNNLREGAKDHNLRKKDDDKNPALIPLASKNDEKLADLHAIETDDHPVATDAQFKKGKKKFSAIRRKANEEVELEVVEEEVEELDEKKVNKIKAGTLNMRDGSQVKVSAKDAADLNSLLKSLDSPANRERFNAEVKNSAEQYKELLRFARRVRKK